MFAKNIGLWASIAFLTLGSAACVKKKQGLTKAEQEALKENILDSLPADVPNKVTVNFDDKVHLIGWKAEPANASPGAIVRMTLYWKKVGELDSGWSLFTHVTTDNVAEAKANLDWTGAIRAEKGGQQLYGPSAWEKNKVIKDTFEYTVPQDTNWPAIRILVGIWKGDTRLKVKDPSQQDGDNRANVIRLLTGVKPSEEAPKKATPPVVPSNTTPQVDVVKLNKADIKIDGKLDDAAWQKALSTTPFVQPNDAHPAATSPVQASGKLAWDDTNLYVAITVNDKNPESPFKPTDVDPHIWSKSSGIEVMIQPGNLGDNKDYYEIQVDTNGAVWDTHFDDYNSPKSNQNGVETFGHQDWKSQIKQSVFINKEAGNYTIEMAIPWASFNKPRNGIHLPPKGGETWRLNLYSFREGQHHALAWSPLMNEGNFHKTSRFALVRFVDGSNPAVAPSTSTSASGAPAPSAPPAPSNSAKPAASAPKPAPSGK